MKAQPYIYIYKLYTKQDIYTWQGKIHMKGISYKIHKKGALWKRGNHIEKENNKHIYIYRETKRNSYIYNGARIPCNLSIDITLIMNIGFHERMLT